MGSCVPVCIATCMNCVAYVFGTYCMYMLILCACVTYIYHMFHCIACNLCYVCCVHALYVSPCCTQVVTCFVTAHTSVTCIVVHMCVV